ncbi:MAG TPA: hypothetical protein VMD99_18655 [Terriglobales bacterium]|nr:hypothetical protein [Terriglobales bacterium]
MHVHATQVNPYAALDALRSAQKTAAKREAERVRQDLMESASELAGESDLTDACVVKLEGREQSQRRQKRRNQPNEPNPSNEKQPADCKEEEEGNTHLSDWA